MIKVALMARSDKPGSFATHVQEGFEEIGAHAKIFQLRSRIEPRRGRLGSAAWILRQQLANRQANATKTLYRMILRELKEFGPDLVLTLMPRTGAIEVDLWRTAAPKARIALWSPDAISNFGDQRAFIAGFDRLFVKDPYLSGRLRAGGLSEVRYLPEGAPSDCLAWYESFNAGGKVEERHEWSAMVGNIYPSRVRFLQDLGSHFPLRIYGQVTARGLPEDLAALFTGEYLWQNDKYEVFNRAKAVINNLHYAEVGSVNYRLFEAAAVGGVVAVDDVPQVARYLEPGSEVIVFKSAQHLVDQLSEMSTGDLESIGRRAQRRMATDHRLPDRLEEMLAELDLR